MLSLRLVVALALAAAAAPGAAWASADPAQLGADLARVEAARGEVAASKEKLEAGGRGEAEEIARLKAQPPGITRDARLASLLAAAQERGQALERIDADLRARDTAIADDRRALVAACDAALGDPGIDESRRAAIARLRDVTLAKLRAGADVAIPIGIARPGPVDPLAGPAELDERADRLKDDEEKLRREALKLDKRIVTLDEKRRLRESAAAVQDDLFGESSPSRGARRAAAARSGVETARGAAGDAASPAPQQGAGGPATGGGGAGNFSESGGSQPSIMLRGVVDPSTLGDLRRTELGGDPDQAVRALAKARAELEARAADLARREAELRRRAAELRGRK